MCGYDVIEGWIGLDGIYRCQKHTSDPVGGIAVFRPKHPCIDCNDEAQSLAIPMRDQPGESKS